MFVSLDLETTGLDKKRDSIIEFGAVKFDLEGHTETFQTFINPGIPIPEFISHLTNIHDKDVSSAPTFHEIAPQILEFIDECPIIGHFISFDVDFMKAKDIKIKNPLYDTAELARIFMPGLPSYSLEILSDILKIQHKEKHRALDDSIAAQELFLRIIDEIKNLKPELLEEIKLLAGRSTWDFAEVLSDIKKSNVNIEKIAQTKGQISQRAPSSVELQTLEIIKSEKKSSLIETPTISAEFIEELSKQSGKGTVIMCPYNLFSEISLPKLSSLDQYISPSRLNTFKKREKFNTPQITSLIKTLIWLEQTEDGLLSESLQFSQDERQILQHIAIDESNANTEPFADRINKLKKEPVLITNFKFTSEEKANHLIIIDVNKFIQDFYFNNSQTLLLKKSLEPIQNLKELFPTQTLLDLEKKLELLFALLEKIGERNFEESAYTQQFELSPLETSDRDFMRAREVVQDLIATSQNLKEIINEATNPYLKAWKGILKDLQTAISNIDLQKNVVVFQKNQSGEIIVRNIPISIVERFKELSKNTKRLTLIGKSLNALDDCRLIKTLLALPEDIKFHTVAPSEKTLKETRIFIANDIRGSQSDIIYQSIAFAKDFLTKEKGRTAMIFNSMSKLEQFHVILAPKLKKNGLSLLAQKGSGGLGKILEMYKNEPNTSTILLTPNNWERFNPQDLTEENDFKNLIIQQIPFDPPSDPFLIAQAKLFADGWNEFQIPRAMLSLKAMISKFLTQTPGRIILLDNRLIEKSYTKPFIKMLEAFKRPEEIASKDLLK